MEDKFNFFVDLSIDDDIFKASGDKKENKYDNMIINGRATVNDEDRQGEILEPSGFIIDDFLKSGMVNLEHYTVRKGDPIYNIGEPIEAKIDNNQFFIKAKLWKDHPKAQSLWDTLSIMKSSGSTRKLGWSIEGSAIKRDPNNPKRVLKAKINHVALTFSPIGYNTYADIVKGEQESDYIEPKHELVEDLFLYEFEKGGELFRVKTDFSIEKAMSAGNETGQALVDKETSGASLKEESLDKRLRVLAPKILPSLKTITEKFKKGEISKEKYENLKKSIEKFLKNK